MCVVPRRGLCRSSYWLAVVWVSTFSDELIGIFFSETRLEMPLYHGSVHVSIQVYRIVVHADNKLNLGSVFSLF